MTNNNFMFDTNIFDRILDGKIDVSKIKNIKKLFVTHIQLDELNAVSNSQRKAKLLNTFQKVIPNKVRTKSAVWDISKWDEAEWSSEQQLTHTETFVLGVSRLGKAKLGTADLYSIIKKELDVIKSKPNNTKDALIAETSIKNGYVLVTDDQKLHKVVKKIGGAVINFKELLQL